MHTFDFHTGKYLSICSLLFQFYIIVFIFTFTSSDIIVLFHLVYLNAIPRTVNKNHMNHCDSVTIIGIVIQ